MKKRKLDLKALELEIPAIEKEETKVILGGNGYIDIPGVDLTKERDDDPDRYDPWNRDDWDMRDDQNDHDHDPDSPDRDGNNDRDHNGVGDPHDNLKVDTGNPNFDKAVRDLLDTNKTLKDAIDKLLEDKSNRITITVGDLGKETPGKEYSLAETTNDGRSYTITFNSNSFDAEGNYVKDSDGMSKDGVDFSKLTSEEEFVETLAHELEHIIYGDRVQDAYDKVIEEKGDINDVADRLSENYGEDFRDIYMYSDDSGWHWRGEDQNDLINNLLHEYIKEHDSDFIEKVLEEYNNQN